MRPDAHAHPYKHTSLIVYTFSEEYTTLLYKLPGIILPPSWPKHFHCFYQEFFFHNLSFGIILLWRIWIIIIFSVFDLHFSFACLSPYNFVCVFVKKLPWQSGFESRTEHRSLIHFFHLTNALFLFKSVKFHFVVHTPQGPLLLAKSPITSKHLSGP